MGNITQEAPTAATVGVGDTEGRDFPEATPCPEIVPQRWQKSKPSREIAGAVILPHLMSGRGNAKKRRELLAATGLRDRAFRHGVEALRRSGTVICANGRGYFLPATVGEVLDFIAQEEHRARSTFFTLRPARELAARMQAQEHGEQIEVEGCLEHELHNGNKFVL